jgi:hypothetical protein
MASTLNLRMEKIVKKYRLIPKSGGLATVIATELKVQKPDLDLRFYLRA